MAKKASASLIVVTLASIGVWKIGELGKKALDKLLKKDTPKTP